jgi:hypothetical protein
MQRCEECKNCIPYEVDASEDDYNKKKKWELARCSVSFIGTSIKQTRVSASLEMRNQYCEILRDNDTCENFEPKGE